MRLFKIMRLIAICAY